MAGPDDPNQDGAPWLSHQALRPLPADAGPWGIARTGGGEVEFEPVAGAEELGRVIRTDIGHSLYFAWTPADRHLRPVFEIEEIAGEVEARGRRKAERELKKSMPAFWATVALVAATILFWPDEPASQFVALLLVLLVILPLWRRGVDRAWDAWRGLRLLKRDPALWRTAEARRLRFAVWSTQGASKVAFALVGMFILTYLAMLRAEPAVAVEYFGLVKEQVRRGEWWRLVTCAWLHGGVVHLLFNSMAGLALAGIARTLVDESRILIVFMLAVVAGSLASMALSPHATSIGASGGILGWGGLLAGLAWAHPALRHCGLLTNMLRWVMILAVIGIAGAQFIDNAAHAGGFLAGVAAGLWFARKPRRPLPLWTPPPRAAWLAAIALGGTAWLAMLLDLLRG